MANGYQLALPVWTRWVKRLAIGHTVLYVTWLILGRWAGFPEIAREMVLVPADVHAGNAWQLASYIASFDHPLSFLFDILALWMFGSSLEQRWGGRRFLAFYAVCAVGSAGLLTLLALAVDRLATLPILGPGAVILGIVVAWGILWADRPAQYFGILPLLGKHLLLLVLGAVLLYALATNPLSFVIHGFGAVLAALFTVGWWRPGRFFGSLRGSWLRWRARRARRHLRPVDDDQDRRYLH
jgi:membrane associated rhomboid family serine protease